MSFIYRRYRCSRSSSSLPQSLIRLSRKTPEGSEIRSRATDILVSLTMDARTEYLREAASQTLGKLIGDTETEARQRREHLFVLNYTYNLIVGYTSDADDVIR